MALGERIRLARESRGATVEELAQIMEMAPRHITAFEEGHTTPENDVLATLTYVLGYHPFYFLMEQTPPEISPMSQHFLLLNDRDKLAVTAQGRIWLDRLFNIESFIPDNLIPRSGYPEGFPVQATDLKAAVKASVDLRRAWSLGRDVTIPNLTDLLDARGIRVLFVNQALQFDACLYIDDERGDPLIVANGTLPGDAQRFGIARELANILIEDVSIDIASFFALAFLAPPPSVRYEMGMKRAVIELAELETLKLKYGLSMRLLAGYMLELGILGQDMFDALTEEFQSERWQNGEPGQEYPPEEFTRLTQMMIRLYAEEDFDADYAAAMLGITVEEWAEILEV